MANKPPSRKAPPAALPLHSLLQQFAQHQATPAVPPVADSNVMAPPAAVPAQPPRSAAQPSRTASAPARAVAPVTPATKPVPLEAPLPPSVPAATFIASDTWEAHRVGALAIYCSDGRWNEACDEFCHSHLKIPNYDRFSLPGGPAFLAQAHSGRAILFEANRPQLDYLVQHHNLARIILITHYGCGFYHELLSLDADGCLPVQMQDVRAAADLLRQWYPKLAIEGYLAMRLGERLSFHLLQT